MAVTSFASHPPSRGRHQARPKADTERLTVRCELERRPVLIRYRWRFLHPSLGN